MKKIVKTVTDAEGNLTEYHHEEESNSKLNPRLASIIYLMISLNIMSFLVLLHVTSHTRYFIQLEKICHVLK